MQDKPRPNISFFGRIVQLQTKWLAWNSGELPVNNFTAQRLGQILVESHYTSCKVLAYLSGEDTQVSSYFVEVVLGVMHQSIKDYDYSKTIE